ncbi:hypothetical protein EIK77_004974 [Talaromyces pinophilus]|nr:hypothetical protein EIK77_004974 [Talaromyces pinophilus]
MAKVEGLENFIGSFLREEVESSPPRLSELKRGPYTFTRAVRLYIPQTEGNDCIVEVILDPRSAEGLLQLLHNSNNDLRPVLGDYLFDGVMKGKLKQNETSALVKNSQAARLIECDGFYCKLEVVIGFRKGIDMFISVFPDPPAPSPTPPPPPTQ